MNNISEGDTVQFIVRVEKSSKLQPIQNVILKVVDINNTHIRGINALRSLDISNDKKPFRSYKIANIVSKSVWKLIG